MSEVGDRTEKFIIPKILECQKIQSRMGKCQIFKSLKFGSHKNGGMGIMNIYLNFPKFCHFFLNAFRDSNHISSSVRTVVAFKG